MASEVFKIPCSWEVCGTIEVSASSLEEAVELAGRAELPEAEYIDGSFDIDHDVAEEINKGIMEKIKVNRTPLKNLPLLIGTLETKEGKNRFDERLRKGK